MTKSYEEYELLKKSALKEITEENAFFIFEGLQRKLLNKIKGLTVSNIADVEDFYLRVAQFNHCLSFVLAKNKADNDQISFDEALGTIGIEDIGKGLSDTFKKEIEQVYLQKIKDIDEQYRPSKESWAALHMRFFSLYHALKETKDFKLTTLIEKNLSFLEIEKNKFVDYGEQDLADTTEALIKNIEAFTKNYLIDQNEFSFNHAINAAIEDALPITEEIGWRRIINNMVRAIIDFFSQDSLSTFSFFNNAIKENIIELQTSLDHQIS